MRIRSTRPYHLPLALLLLAGCNSDPLNGPGPSGSGTVSGLQVTDSQDQSVRAWRSPARVSFTLATQDPGGSADVTLTFSRDGGVTFQPVTTGEDDVLINLPSGEHDVSWLFAAPTDLGTDRYRGGVIVRAEVTNGNSEQRTVELGNDVPVVLSVETPSADVKGDADVNFTVADVAGDRLSLRVEFNQDAAGEFPTDSWQLARPVGVDPTSDTPAFALTDIEPPFGGSALAGTFTWASAFDPAGDPAVSEQVASLDGDVKLRFTAVDEFGVEGATVETAVFLVDNNEPPSLSLDGDFLVNGIKDRGNIPLSFTVTDEDSDEVQIAVQWKTATGSFPLVRNGSGQEVELGSLTPSELRDLLENPARRQDRLDGQIALEDPLVYEGRLGTLDDLGENQVRLPELASSQAGLVAQGLVGRELELIRPVRSAQPEFGLNELPLDGISEARGAFVTEEGRSALLLHASEGATWSISEVDLGDGSVKSEVATGSGTPRCLAADPRGEFLFVGTDQDVFRIKRFTGEVSAPLPHELILGPRGLAALGADVVLVTGDDKLRRLDFRMEASSPSAILMEGLAQPWGIVRDPLRASGIYLAESSASNGVGEVPGRIWAIDLDQLVREEVAARVEAIDQDLLGSVPFPNVKALALERDGSRLLAMTAQAGRKELRSLALRSPLSISSQSLAGIDTRADPLVGEEGLVADVIGSVATGRRGIRVVAPWNGNSVGVHRVTLQARSIVAYDPATQVVTLDDGPALPAEEGLLWRVLARSRDSVGSPGGRSVNFLWDTSALPDPSEVMLRALAADPDHRSSEVSTNSKDYRGDWLTPSSWPTSDGPVAVAAADLDGDGDVDLVSADSQSNRLTLRFQGAPGIFDEEVVSLATGGQPVSVAAADLDGDGDMDLVSANQASASLTLFFQTSPGTFIAAAAPLPSGNSPVSVAAADLDGDGDIDLCSANQSSDSLSLFFQTTPGTFSPAETLATGFGPRSVIAADLDGDGDIDLCSANQIDHSLTLFFQNGPGSFTQSPDPFNTELRPVSVAAADLDGDGDMDLVSANLDGENLTLFFQTASGTFDQSSSLVARGHPNSVTAADLDGDGDMDLVSANQTNTKLTLFFQTASGTFGPPASLVDGGNASAVAAADLDGDGDVDLMYSDYSTYSDTGNNTISLLFSASQGEFTDGVLSLTTPDLDRGEPVSVAAADLDGDGDLDVVSANSISNNIDLFFQGEPGNFTEVETIQVGDRPESVIAADLDGDGDMDLVSVNETSDEVFLVFQSALGAFDRTTSLQVPIPKVAATVDLDADGDLDLLVGGLNGVVTLFHQTLPGTFTQEIQPLTFPGESGFSDLKAADLNGDGNVDIVASYQSGGIVLALQEPLGTFMSSETLNAVSPQSIEVVDIDEDGDIDIASIGNDRNVRVFIQEKKEFAASQVLRVGEGPRAISVADMNGDKLLDLVVANRASNDISICYQVVPGKFAREVILNSTPGSSLEAVVAADIDGDGDLDLVSPSSGHDEVKIFLNGN